MQPIKLHADAPLLARGLFLSTGLALAFAHSAHPLSWSWLLACQLYSITCCTILYLEVNSFSRRYSLPFLV